MMGFDNYTKGANAAAAQRRKGGSTDTHRFFSKSSISYNASAADSAANTPGSSHAPTPVSTTFAGGSGSNHPTPTSATASTGKAGGGGGGSKKDKKKAISLSVDAGGDSESDINVKKVRTNFGASRK
jgi:chromatin modification-related protein EAF6